MKWIYDLSLNELKNEIKILGLRDFIADQVFQWIYQKNCQDIKLWSNINKYNRELFIKKYNITLNRLINKQKDREETKKFLIELEDENRIESVLIKEKNYYTFCISSQVGCALNCAFCATGKMGFIRNLSSGEILSQILILKKEIDDYKGKINIVFMGMGEPLLNYENLKKALSIITSEKGAKIPSNNTTVSTAGVLKYIKQIEMDFPNIKISFSLNASDNKAREQLMPISKKENLSDILDHFKNFKRKHRITFEYVLIKDINDSIKDAKKVSQLLKGILCKINLIPYNENTNIDFKTPSKKNIEAFKEYLCLNGYTVILRWSKGKDIKSACGQLATQTKHI